MKLSEFSVKNSLLINLISIFILLAGLYTFYVYKIRREAFPEVSFDKVVVTTTYRGASPEEIEKLITIPLEKELKGVDGIKEMSSTSLDTVSIILLDLNEGLKDKRKTISDIQQAVDQVQDLPGEAERPIVNEITSGEIPVIEVVLSGNISEFELQNNAERLEDILEDVSGVSKVTRKGWRDKEVWVEVDPDKLSKFHLSLFEVIEALSRKNVSIPGGKLRGDKEYTIRTVAEFHRPAEIEKVVIRANELGNWLKVKDVAEVRFAHEDENVINKSLGTRAINLTVVKRSSGDAIKIVQQLKKDVSQFLETANPNLNIAYIDDISFYIQRRLGVLKNNGIIGFILICGMLLLFLNYRTAIITAVSLPIAFCAAVAAMAILGLSINLITMFGLIIVLGMLVDDGIIVAENCARYKEMGYSSKKAAILGTNEVVKPVTTTIITTIAAFSPLFFIEGMLGKFIWGIPVVVIIALIASLFEAFVILPSHFSDFVPNQKKAKIKEQDHWFRKIISFYSVIINKALKRKYWVMLAIIILFVTTIFTASRMPFILFGSEEGIEQFYIRAEAPVGINLYKTEELISQIEKKIEELPKDEIDAYTTEVGSIGKSWMFDPYGKKGSHVAQITVYLAPHTERTRSVNEIIDYLRKEMEGIKGFKDIYFEKEEEGPPVGRPIAVTIRGEKFETLEEISKKIEDYLKKIKGVKDIASDYELGENQIQVIVDEEKAAIANLTVSDIASSVNNAFRGGLATSIKPTQAEEEIDVLVRFPEEYRKDAVAFSKIMVPNKAGRLIRLEKVSKLEDKVSVNRINHLDGKRAITVRAGVDKQNITSIEANQKIQEKFSDISKTYPGYGLEFRGEQEENVKSTRSFLKAFILAGFLIFLILAANFNSLVQPLVVMMAIPFGLIGVIWAFFFHGLSLGFFMMVGIVGLTGIVVNDSIVLVDFINNLRRQGKGRRESIIEAGKLRLRPVILTTITTSLGLTPTAYGIGGGDPFLKPMALTIVWGILCASFLTLVVLPCIYAIIDDITLKLAGHATVIKN
ncbi:MAG: efflux RND transporter permease subunit, partial [Candidatus Omnitrophica bacterium]|nr:efflux RND transporter permease subunit [Candidatus Omnitrophota bacterium]